MRHPSTRSQVRLVANESIGAPGALDGRSYIERSLHLVGLDAVPVQADQLGPQLVCQRLGDGARAPRLRERHGKQHGVQAAVVPVGLRLRRLQGERAGQGGGGEAVKDQPHGGLFPVSGWPVRHPR